MCQIFKFIQINKSQQITLRDKLANILVQFLLIKLIYVQKFVVKNEQKSRETREILDYDTLWETEWPAIISVG